MICNKCNHKLPDDSEFCQYCGNKLEKLVTAPTEMVIEEPKKVEIPVVDSAAPEVPVSPVANDELSIDDTIPDEALNAILKTQGKYTIDVMETNRKTQPNNEGDADFGLVPKKPIFTLALMSVDGEIEYLNRLYTTTGEKIKYNRRGSMSVEGINGMIDIYDTFLPSGQPYKTIYINMYGAKESTKSPAGFVLNNTTRQKQPAPEKEKTFRTKYCSHCGSIVDNKSKICTGCGKQYFRGFRFSKFSVTIIALALIIAMVSILCVFQYVNTKKLKNKISDLNEQISMNETTIDLLKNNADKLEDEKWDNWTKLRFFDTYAVMVNSGSKKYHKYGCSDFDESSFWIYNIDAAEDKGYYACPKCH